MVGGALRFARKFAGAPFSVSSVRKQSLRQRCDARGFKPLPIEIIAQRRVTPALSPKIGMHGWLELLTTIDKKGSRDWTPPPPDTPWWGGRGSPRKICRGPIFHFKR